jgi:hypothetical protein
MTQSGKRRLESEVEPVRVLGRGLRAARGVHLTLRTLRDAAGKTQINVARESEMDQGDISRLETRSNFDDCQVITLRRYVEALGGSLEMVARFGDKRIVIAGVEPRPGMAAKVLARTNLPRRSSKRTTSRS